MVMGDYREFVHLLALVHRAKVHYCLKCAYSGNLVNIPLQGITEFVWDPGFTSRKVYMLLGLF